MPSKGFFFHHFLKADKTNKIDVSKGHTHLTTLEQRKSSFGSEKKLCDT